MQVFDLLTRIRELSPAASRALLGKAIPRIIPLADGMRIHVDDWTPTRCALSMPVIKRTRNHLGAMYFGAQMTLADLTVGVLLFQRYPMGPYGGVIRSVEADFKAKAKGRLTCVAELSEETARVLDAVRAKESGKSEAWIPMTLSDPEGRVVTTVRTLVAIKRFGQAEA